VCGSVPGRELGPHVALGAGTVVGADVRLTDSVTFTGVTVGERVHATGLLAGHDVRIDDDASLGREVVLGDGHHVAAGSLVAEGTRWPAPDAA
jgi:NDP-sugar pyrophosphorylase family protein